MTITVNILSGLNRKAPAAILVTTPSQRILLDAGSGLECDDVPWTLPSDIDAVLISHDHIDHIGGLGRLPANTAVYCTAVTARALPTSLDVHIIDVKGKFSLGDLTVTTGSSGHAYGGVWFHLDIPGGLFYSGDISLESTFFHFDPPPPAQLALIDASYGLYDVTLSQQQDEFLSRLSHPIICPVPPSGRAIEMALLAARHGIESIALDAPCYMAFEQMAHHNDGSLIGECHAALATLQPILSTPSSESRLILAADPDGEAGMASELRSLLAETHRTLFTGHLTQRAHRQWQVGEVDFCRWNVHPSRQSLQQLVTQLACQQLVPLFTPLHNIPLWQQLIGCQLITHPFIELNL